MENTHSSRAGRSTYESGVCSCGASTSGSASLRGHVILDTKGTGLYWSGAAASYKASNAALGSSRAVLRGGQESEASTEKIISGRQAGVPHRTESEQGR